MRNNIQYVCIRRFMRGLQWGRKVAGAVVKSYILFFDWSVATIATEVTTLRPHCRPRIRNPMKCSISEQTLWSEDIFEQSWFIPFIRKAAKLNKIAKWVMRIWLNVCSNLMLFGVNKIHSEKIKICGYVLLHLRMRSPNF